MPCRFIEFAAWKQALRFTICMPSTMPIYTEPISHIRSTFWSFKYLSICFLNVVSIYLDHFRRQCLPDSKHFLYGKSSPSLRFPLKVLHHTLSPWSNVISDFTREWDCAVFIPQQPKAFIRQFRYQCCWSVQPKNNSVPVLIWYLYLNVTKKYLRSYLLPVAIFDGLHNLTLPLHNTWEEVPFLFTVKTF